MIRKVHSCRLANLNNIWKNMGGNGKSGKKRARPKRGVDLRLLK